MNYLFALNNKTYGNIKILLKTRKSGLQSLNKTKKKGIVDLNAFEICVVCWKI